MSKEAGLPGVVVIAVIAGTVFLSSREPAEPVASAAAVPTAEEAAFALSCLSAWDGSLPGLVKAVKDRLNDPESFAHDDTRVWTVQPDGRNRIVMDFRAANGFGGTMRYRAEGSFDNESCGEVQVDLIE
jgi:hypothetical protein